MEDRKLLRKGYIINPTNHKTYVQRRFNFTLSWKKLSRILTNQLEDEEYIVSMKSKYSLPGSKNFMISGW
jgi:hypothetical protein